MKHDQRRLDRWADKAVSLHATAEYASEIEEHLRYEFEFGFKAAIETVRTQLSKGRHSAKAHVIELLEKVLGE